MEMLIIKIGKKYFFLNKNKIDWIESEGSYLKIHTENKYYIIRMSLIDIESKLNSDIFIRINRSTIININKVKELTDTKQSTEFVVVLNNETILKWKRRYRKNFPETLLVK